MKLTKEQRLKEIQMIIDIWQGKTGANDKTRRFAGEILTKHLWREGVTVTVQP